MPCTPGNPEHSRAGSSPHCAMEGVLESGQVRLRVQRELVACKEPTFFSGKVAGEARSSLPVLLLDSQRWSSGTWGGYSMCYLLPSWTACWALGLKNKPEGLRLTEWKSLLSALLADSCLWGQHFMRYNACVSKVIPVRSIPKSLQPP